MTDRDLIDRMFYNPQGGVEWEVFLRAFGNERLCFEKLAKFRASGIVPPEVRSYCTQHLPKEEALAA